MTKMGVGIVAFVWGFLTVSACAAEDSPLFAAVTKGERTAVEVLLTKGADVSAKNEYGWTPLHTAANLGRNDLAELLLAKGADVNAKNRWKQEYGVTPLHVAANAGHKDMVGLLLAKGADANAKDNSGWTPLLIAIGKNKWDIVNLMENHLLERTNNQRELFGQLSRQLEGNNINRPSSLVLDLEKSSPSQGGGIQLPPANFIRSLVLQLDDISTRRLVIKLGRQLKPAPAISEEARKYFVEGSAIVKAAKNSTQQVLAVTSFIEALKIAPWWGDAYYNLGVAQDLAERYDEAEIALNFYLLTNPSEVERRDVQDRIYALSAKRKLAGMK